MLLVELKKGFRHVPCALLVCDEDPTTRGSLISNINMRSGHHRKSSSLGGIKVEHNKSRSRGSRSAVLRNIQVRERNKSRFIMLICGQYPTATFNFARNSNGF